MRDAAYQDTFPTSSLVYSEQSFHEDHRNRHDRWGTDCRIKNNICYQKFRVPSADEHVGREACQTSADILDHPFDNETQFPLPVFGEQHAADYPEQSIAEIDVKASFEKIYVPRDAPAFQDAAFAYLPSRHTTLAAPDPPQADT